MYIFFALAIGWTIFLLINAGMDGKSSSTASGNVALIVENGINTFVPNTINDSNRDNFKFITRKVIGHFLSFTLLAMLISIGFKCLIEGYNIKKNKLYISIIISLSYGLLIAVITELMQLTTTGRSGQITDVLIDYGGYLLGCLIMFVIFLIIYSVTKHKTNNKDVPIMPL